MSNQWIDVIAHPPKVGQWAIVLCDGWSEDMGQAEARYKLWKISRFSVKTAVLFEYDPEGWPIWRASYDTLPRNGYYDVRNVTHYKPLDASLPDEEAWEVPLWASIEPLDEGLACARRCASLNGSCGRMRQCLGKTSDNMFGRQF